MIPEPGCACGGYDSGHDRRCARYGNDRKRFTLDGETIQDLGAFCAENDLEPEQLNAIGRLDVGQSLTLGGGAAAEFTLARVQ